MKFLKLHDYDGEFFMSFSKVIRFYSRDNQDERGHTTICMENGKSPYTVSVMETCEEIIEMLEK
jgi:hypothetical protein